MRRARRSHNRVRPAPHRGGALLSLAVWSLAVWSLAVWSLAAGSVAEPSDADAAREVAPERRARLDQLEADLRETLEEYFVHVLESDLALDDETAARVRPRLAGFLEAQRTAAAERERLRRDLAASVQPGTEDAAAAARVARELLQADETAMETTFSARDAILDELRPRERVAFLVFSDRFREAVRRHVRAVKQGARPDRADRPPGAGARLREPPLGREPPPPHGPRRDLRRPSPPRARAPAAGGPPALRPQELRDDFVAMLSLELRREAELSVEELLRLLPDLERLVDAQLRHHQAEVGATRRLERAARAADAGRGSDERIAGLVDRVDAHQRRLLGELLAARRALVESLPPLAGARFLLLTQRLEEEAAPRLRRLRRLQAAHGPPPDR